MYGVGAQGANRESITTSRDRPLAGHRRHPRLPSFIVVEGVSLWREWKLLENDLSGARDSAIIGFRDVSPVASYAQGPSDWFRETGNQSLLWSHWENGVGHQWFRFAHGDIDQARLRRPPTHFLARPVDYPLIETDGGEIWQRIPMEAAVVGHTLHGVKCVYPVSVLGKVLVVNDMVQDHGFLIAVNMFAPKEAFSIFDADQTATA